MSAARLAPARQAGVYAVEFAITVAVLLIFLLGVIEMARAIYIYNTLQEVTRHAAADAAVTNFHDAAAMAGLRNRAVFRSNAGALLMGDPVTSSYVYIDYLALVRNADGSLRMKEIAPSSIQSCPARNRMLCMGDPNDPGCIRFVRARICAPGTQGACGSVPYKTLVPMISLPATLAKAPTIVPAESLGWVPGTGPCG